MNIKGAMLGALAVMLVPLSASAEITDNTDRFSGARTIRYSSDSEIALRAPMINIVGLDLRGDRSGAILVSIGNSSRGPNGGWQYLKCRETHWLADGHPFAPEKSTYDGDVLRGGVLEKFTYHLTVDQLSELAAAQTIEFKICNDEFAFTPADIEGLREVRSRLLAAGSPPPES